MQPEDGRPPRPGFADACQSLGGPSVATVGWLSWDVRLRNMHRVTRPRAGSKPGERSRLGRHCAPMCPRLVVTRASPACLLAW
jgi:hypothetical protein